MNFMPFVILLAVIAVVVLALLMYRRKLTAWEDDTIHIHEGEEKMLEQQAVLAQKVAKVDLAGKILTAIVVIGALVLAAVYIYIHQIADTGVRVG